MVPPDGINPSVTQNFNFSPALVGQENQEGLLPGQQLNQASHDALDDPAVQFSTVDSKLDPDADRHVPANATIGSSGSPYK